MQSTKAKASEKAIGQFSDEYRYEMDLSTYPETLTKVLADFYNHRLFRIEMNYLPIAKSSQVLHVLIDENTELYGPPRVNSFTGVRLLFWDDGATRMILQIDETDTVQTYSVTYIDDDLFHAASRDRVQRETSGRSNYGK